MKSFIPNMYDRPPVGGSYAWTLSVYEMHGLSASWSSLAYCELVLLPDHICALWPHVRPALAFRELEAEF